MLAFAAAAPFFVKLAAASEVIVCDNCAEEGAVSIVSSGATVYIPLAEMVDFEAERRRLEGELANTENEIRRVEGKLSNAGFVSKAPAAVVEAEREKLAKYQAALESLKTAIAALPR